MQEAAVKVLINDHLDDHHLTQIQSTSEDVDLVIPDSSGDALDVMPEIDIIFGGMSRDMFKRAESLKWVQTWGAGVDGMMYAEFVHSEVILTSAKGTVGVHLSEHAMALLLGLTRGIARAIRTTDWNERMPIRHASWELIDKTMGIVGLGGTGCDVAIRAHAFGMKIIAVDPEDVDVPDCVETCWKMDRFYDLLSASDIVVVCCPLTEETRGLFDRMAFEKMQNHALLINVTRGKIMDDASLVEALKTGQIAGAGLDVTPQEPLPGDHPLWNMPNVIITPHTAGGSPNRQDRIVNLFCENLRRFLKGEDMLSVIEKKKGY
jgi:phosphoglycerate dehydrogenase-like enzyme